MQTHFIHLFKKSYESQHWGLDQTNPAKSPELIRLLTSALSTLALQQYAFGQVAVIHVRGHKSLGVGSEQSRGHWQDMRTEEPQGGKGCRAGALLGSVPKGAGLLVLSLSSD